MKSHNYEFGGRELLRVLAPPLVPLACFAALMHLGAWCNLLPASRPAYDIDRTVLIHQAEAARSVRPAEVLLIGDSSCLMNVCARDMGRRLGRSVLNLGCVSYLDLTTYASMLRQYTAANPGYPRAVVVLMHPEALRRHSPERDYAAFLKGVFENSAPARSGAAPNKLNPILGLDIFKSRLLARWLPAPLAGINGKYYGFTADLEKFLDEHDGSMVDPNAAPFRGNAEYCLASQLQPASGIFHAAVPPGAKLFVAITPVPASFPRKNYPKQYEQMLRTWSEWLHAQPLDLPATMPDPLFVKTTHLNETGQKAYTVLLAKALKPHLP